MWSLATDFKVLSFGQSISCGVPECRLALEEPMCLVFHTHQFQVEGGFPNAGISRKQRQGQKEAQAGRDPSLWALDKALQVMALPEESYFPRAGGSGKS